LKDFYSFFELIERKFEVYYDLYKRLFITVSPGVCMKLFDAVMLGLAIAVLMTTVISIVVPGFEKAWVALSMLGDEQFYAGVSAVLYLLVSRDLGLALLSVLLLSSSTNVVLKELIKAPRPPPELWLVKEVGYGFPSGHSQLSSSFWGLSSLLVRRKSLSLLSALMVFSVSVSRVLLRVHSVDQVLGGAAIGFALACLAFWVSTKRGIEGSATLLSSVSVLLSAVFIPTFLAYPDEWSDVSVSNLAKIASMSALLAMYTPLTKIMGGDAGYRRLPLRFRLATALLIALLSVLLVRLSRSLSLVTAWIPYAASVFMVLYTPHIVSALIEKKRKT